MARTVGSSLLLSVVVLELAAISRVTRAAPATPVGSAHATNPTPPLSQPEAIRRGIVQVEQGGRPLAVGTVLANDGRVLTALSSLTNVAEPDIRYADGSVVRAKIVHTDDAWDLALLAPTGSRWRDGLSPTDSDPQGVELRSFLPKGGKLAQASLVAKGRIDAKAKHGDELRSALEIDFKGAVSVPGAPLVDPSGHVVGVLIKACKPAVDLVGPASRVRPVAEMASGTPCVTLTVGAPVYALRAFLMKAPVQAAAPSAWLGLGGASTEPGGVKGVRVVGVAPGSPAEASGLKAGGQTPDVIVAVDGTPVETPEQLASSIAQRGVDQQVKFLVFSQGKFREVLVTLRAAP